MNDWFLIKRQVKILLVLISVGTILLFSILVSVLVILLIFFRGEFFINNKRKEEISSKYKYYQHNPRTNETSRGFVSFFREEVKPLDFIFFEDENGFLNLITNSQEVDEELYSCYGYCRCSTSTTTEKDLHNRRGSSSVLYYSRSVQYLVLGFSSLVAGKFAKDYFEEMCTTTTTTSEEIGKECPSNSMMTSELDSCEKVEKNEVKLSKKEEKGEKNYEFICSGSCMSNLDLLITSSDDGQLLLLFTKRIRRQITARCQAVTLTLHKYFTLPFELRDMNSKIALKEFIEVDLEKYCGEGLQTMEGFWGEKLDKLKISSSSFFCRGPTLKEVSGYGIPKEDLKRGFDIIAECV